MTDKRIHEIIQQYNQPNSDIFITSQPISTYVRFALVWDDADFHHLHDNSPYRFYLLLNSDHQAVGAVLDMNRDLHWYLDPNARKKGLLTRALQNSILPHLARFRKSQRISITKSEIGVENYRASLAVAKACKFRIQGGIKDQTICTQSLKKYRSMALTIRTEGMDFDEMAELRKRMNVVVANLWQIQATVTTRLGKSHYSEELKKTIDLLNRYRTFQLEDALFDYQDRHSNQRS